MLRVPPPRPTSDTLEPTGEPPWSTAH